MQSITHLITVSTSLCQVFFLIAKTNKDWWSVRYVKKYNWLYIGSTITGKPIVYIVAHKLGQKKVIKINMTSKKLSWPESSRLFTSLAEELNSELPWTNPDSRRDAGGTRTQGLRSAMLPSSPGICLLVYLFFLLSVYWIATQRLLLQKQKLKLYTRIFSDYICSPQAFNIQRSWLCSC